MQFTNIAGAATLTAIGIGSLAASAVLWKRAGFDVAGIARVIEALNS